MSDTPLYNSLLKLAKSGKARFHMPGNKGIIRNCALDGAIEIDYTEIPETGNLYTSDGEIHEAERLAAEYYGAQGCIFLTCGATQGIKAMLATFCGAGGEVLLDRNCHKSAIDGCALLDIMPSYICPETIENYGITGNISDIEVDKILKSKPEIRAVLITSPTYYGFNLDLKKLAEAVHKNGAYLIADSAHGSHLRAIGVNDALSDGADAVVFSAHKTLGALTQGAYLVLKSTEKAEILRENCALFGTTSPSYPIMASLDLSQKWIRSDDWNELCVRCDLLRENVERRTKFEIPNLGDKCRITIFSQKAGISGNALADMLRKQGIEPEMSDVSCAVCIATPQDLNGNLERLENALLDIEIGAEILTDKRERTAEKLPLPKQVVSPRKAVFAPYERVKLRECDGRISAQSIAPYPPGVPVIAPGERIHKNYIEYLAKMDYNIDSNIKVLTQEY